EMLAPRKQRASKHASNMQALSVSVSLSETTGSSKEEKTITAGSNGHPTLEQVKDFWEKGSREGFRLAGSPDKFYDHFQARGWRFQGGRGGLVKDWQAAARNWARNEREVPR